MNTHHETLLAALVARRGGMHIVHNKGCGSLLYSVHYARLQNTSASREGEREGSSETHSERQHDKSVRYGHAEERRVHEGEAGGTGCHASEDRVDQKVRGEGPRWCMRRRRKVVRGGRNGRLGMRWDAEGNVSPKQHEAQEAERAGGRASSPVLGTT
jgi:hypothetical protein